ncbi:hypothetical protein L596_012222 [Steinernema carpocapsae]|nr:hypothetical protein L596_012222 [Steinernema carpocapsae]
MSSSEGDTDAIATKKVTEKENLVNGHHKKDDVIMTNGDSKNIFDKYEFDKDAHNRVKMYVLIEQRVWDDRGTGHVACVPQPENPNAYSIIVRLENSEKNILESKIQVDTIYQKQQETLIVWSENETCDLALSFQEKTGCEEIWETICRVQGKDPDEMLYDNDSEDSETNEPTSIASTSSQQGSSLLPSCEIGKLPDIEAALANALATAETREKMAMAVEQMNYIEKMCDIFGRCEDLELSDACKTCYMIAKNLFYLNRANLLEHLLDEKNLRSIVGMLEYDPTSPEQRKHREFLFEQSRFREVLPIHKEELRDRIHDNFRAQYIQDVCLPAPSILEENLLTVLASHLFFNRIEIVKMLAEDKVLIKQLFDELKDKNITVQRRKELASFLKEFCSYSQSLQPNGPQGRDMFLKLLMSNDVLAAVDLCIISPDATTRTITVELLSLIVENNPTFVRDFLVQQGKNTSEVNDNDLLINRMIGQMFKDRDPELTSAQQMGQVLRLLVDPENMTAKSDKTEFLPFFYRRSITTLVQPLLDNTEKGVIGKDTYYVANQQTLILELLSFCIQHHSFSMRNYCMHHDLLNRVLVLLKSKHHFLALYALRLFRRILNLRDEFYIKYIVRESVLSRVVDAFVANGRRYNVMNSAILELFEFIAHENISLLVTYAVDHHWEHFESVEYVETFRSLKKRYEANKREREGSHDSISSDTSSSIRSEQWKKEQECDKEENWFGSGDDDDEWIDKNGLQSLVNGDPPAQRKSGMEPNYPSIVKRPSSLLDDDGVASVFGGSSITAPINGNKISISAPKIVIKVPTISDRSRSPSPAASTSRSPSPGSLTASPSKSQSASPVPSPAPTTPYMLKEVGLLPIVRIPWRPKLFKDLGGLVDYDESDSDDEDEVSSPSNSQPSSVAASTSSPTEEETPSPAEEEKKDVEKDSGGGGDGGGTVNGHMGNGKRTRSFDGCDAEERLEENGECSTDLEKDLDYPPNRKRCR